MSENLLIQRKNLSRTTDVNGLHVVCLEHVIKDVETIGSFAGIVQNTKNGPIRKIITSLWELADWSDKIGMDVKIADTVGNGVAIAGSALVIGGLIAAPFTAGISVILSITGSGIAAAGGLTSVGANITSVVATNKTTSEAKALLEELNASTQQLAILLEEAKQALERLKQHLPNIDNWPKVIQDLLKSGTKCTVEQITELLNGLLSQLPPGCHLQLPVNIKSFINGIDAYHAIIQNPSLAAKAQELCKLNCTARSAPGVAAEVAEVTAAFKGAPVALSATQRALGGAFAGVAFLTSVISIVQTWTSSNETPAAFEIRKIANELETLYPAIDEPKKIEDTAKTETTVSCQ